MGLSSDVRGSASRLAAYVETLSAALGHTDRVAPFRAYCAGLLLPGERKSVEPMAARIEPARVRAAHQSLHHFVAQADWSDDALLAAVRAQVLPVMQQTAPIRGWMVDDTGIAKKGSHSVGVARQYCGQLGKQDTCQVAVTLSLARACPRAGAAGPVGSCQPADHAPSLSAAAVGRGCGAASEDRRAGRGDLPNQATDRACTDPGGRVGRCAAGPGAR